jgi:hypothetical protein
MGYFKVTQDQMSDFPIAKTATIQGIKKVTWEESTTTNGRILNNLCGYYKSRR